MGAHPEQLRLTNGKLRTVRKRYLKANAFELFVALLAFVASISYWLQPQNLAASSVGRVAFPDVMWNTLYGVGAVIIILGLFGLSPRVEVAGLSLFTSAVLIQAVALAYIRGVSTSAAGLAVLIGFALASITRAYDLIQTHARETKK